MGLYDSLAMTTPNTEPIFITPPPPHFSNSTIPDIKNTLDQKQLAALEQLELFLGDLDSEDAAFCDQKCLLRYLKARDYNPKKAYRFLLQSLEWRKNYGPHRITPEDMKEESKWGLMYRHGHDKFKRPINYLRPVLKNSEDYEVMLRYMIFNIENAVASMDISSDVEHSTWIIDYRGFSIWSAPPISFGVAVVTTLMNYYPERLGLMVLYEPPTSLQFCWSAVSPMLNSRTKKKR